MPAGSVDFKVNKKRHTLLMNIGVIEKLSELPGVDGIPTVLLASFANSMQSLEELRAVFAEGLAASEDDLEADTAIEELGLEPARRVALNALMSAFKVPDGGNVEAAGAAEIPSE